jgi:alkylated DNA repair dioxygenase AlkB
MGDAQLGFFDEAPRLPEGFRYQPDLIGPDDERRLIDQIQTLPFREFEFHGYTGKRRVVSFGWRYDFAKRAVFRADDIPDFLDALRHIVADFGGLPALELQQVLVSEYQEGAGIGWHRDKAVFGDVIGVSLLSACDFRLRRKQGESWERVTITAEPRSAYLLRGPSRTEWEHSIPGVDALRYSITFRNLKD